nr:hypothetical protein [Tanacetum cinerariifolium]
MSSCAAMLIFSALGESRHGGDGGRRVARSYGFAAMADVIIGLCLNKGESEPFFGFRFVGDDDFSSSGGNNTNNPPCKVADKSEIVRILAGQIVGPYLGGAIQPGLVFAAMAESDPVGKYHPYEGKHRRDLTCICVVDSDGLIGYISGLQLLYHESKVQFMLQLSLRWHLQCLVLLQMVMALFMANQEYSTSLMDKAI